MSLSLTCMPLYLYVCLSLCISLSLFLSLSAYLSVCYSSCLSIYFFSLHPLVSVCMALSLPFCLSLCLFFPSLSIFFSLHPPVSVCLFLSFVLPPPFPGYCSHLYFVTQLAHKAAGTPNRHTPKLTLLQPTSHKIKAIYICLFVISRVEPGRQAGETHFPTRISPIQPYFSNNQLPMRLGDQGWIDSVTGGAELGLDLYRYPGRNWGITGDIEHSSSLCAPSQLHVKHTGTYDNYYMCSYYHPCHMYMYMLSPVKPGTSVNFVSARDSRKFHATKK